jgi:hypothetical protein
MDLEEMGYEGWTGFIWRKMEISCEFYEHGNERSGFIRGWKYLDRLSDYQVIKNDCSVNLERARCEIDWLSPEGLRLDTCFVLSCTQ